MDEYQSRHPYSDRSDHWCGFGTGCASGDSNRDFGRYFCMAVNIPGTVYGFENSRLFWLCVIFGTILVAAYCIIWYFWFWKNTLFRALSLSILPSVLFIFCGIMSRSILLIVFSAIFAPCHILISVKNCTQN